MFLMPGLVITCYVTGCLDTVLTAPHKAEMLRYLKNHQNADGGYGLHIEGHSTMFGTALRWVVSPYAHCPTFEVQPSMNMCSTNPFCCSYITMRILGLPAEDETCKAAQRWVRAYDTLAGVPTPHASSVSMVLCFLEATLVTCTQCNVQILDHEGATHITSWGKFWLAVLGCYSWDGMNPTPPEIWMLPYATWTGIGLAHPGRFWCHCRMVGP